MTEKITIITIVYNGMPFLKQCVESVLKQNYPNWELLISDDGSKDGSREYLRSLEDPRIRIFNQEKNLGIFGNLNFLFREAKAPITQILCQDDYFVHTDSLRTILTYWENKPPSLGFVRFNHSNEQTRGLVQYEKKIVPNIINAGEADIWFYIFGNIPGNLSNVSLRTAMVEDVGWFSQSLPYAGDFDFWVRSARKYDMGIEKQLVIFVRSHPGQASHYLNFNGELIAQKTVVINDLYLRILEKFKNSRFLLNVLGTVNYDSFQRDIAVKGILKGKMNYYNQLRIWQSKSLYSVSPTGRWIAFCLTLGGRLGRVVLAKFFINRNILNGKG